MNANVRRKLTKARIALITLQPFWGSLALRLQLVEEPSIPTLAVDGKTVWYNPTFVDGLSHELTMSAMAHEVGHCVFDHVGRRGARNPDKWNRAGDYIINAMLKDSGMAISPSWLYNPKWGADMSADQVYNLLPDPPPGGGGGGDGPGPLCDIRQTDTKANPASSDGWKIAVAQAAMAAQQAGKLPSSLERFVKELLNPKTDWKTQLRRFVTEKAKNDYSWQRPAKMMIPHGFYLPSLYSEQMGEMVIAVDTSGSIGQKQLDIFGAEIQAIRDAVSPVVTRVIYCDAQVNHVEEFAAEDVLEMRMVGHGGTDFRPPFDLVENEGWKPAAFVYLTDGYGPFPDTPPDYPAMWCMTTDVEAPWGETLKVDAE